MGQLKILILFVVMVFAAVFSIRVLAQSSSCWAQTTQSTCQAIASCNWKTDTWGSWCEELSCWSLYNQSACTTTSVPGKNCTWTLGSSSGWCEERGCWSFDGTNQSTCEQNNISRSCTWAAYCTGSGGGVGCYNIQSESLCRNTTGCSWGYCNQRSCLDYTTQNACVSGTGTSGRACRWDSTYSYCYESGCSNNYNQSACTSAGCKWNSNGYCTEYYCSDFDFTNSSACVNTTKTSYNLSCAYQDPYCNTRGCWNFNTQNACDAENSCRWKTPQQTGWCEEINCWSWDSWRGGTNNTCLANSSIYNLGCSWSWGNASNSSGYCWKNYTTSGVSCANKTTENECIATYYCFWQFADPSNPAGGGTCRDPSNVTAFNGTIFVEWNPGCYIFDLNASACGNVTGCSWTGSSCATINTDVQQNGLKCSNINESQLCNNIPALSKCCTWQGSSCSNNTYSTSCFTQVQQPPTGASFCEDYNAYTSQSLCEQIANYPWFMPCKWDNSTSRCKFNTGAFGNATQSLVLIDNERNCEAAGGKWITENYCEGNISVPAGRCEQKFDDETNCNKACYACERKSDGGAWNSTATARAGCLASKLGICEFMNDTRAPNGYGYCKVKDEFKTGEKNCRKSCAACTFTGNPFAAQKSSGSGYDNCNAPSCYCDNSPANCKWLPDQTNVTDESKGVCIGKNEQTCADACDRCETQNACQTIGRTAISNVSGGCTWNSAQSLCLKSGQAGSTGEICWDGVDNNNDGLIDCADPACYSDSFCGFTEGNCFGFTNNNTCISNGCEWITDPWGSWCDYAGARCWENDGNETACRAATLVANERLNITVARIIDNGINTSLNFTLQNNGSGWVNASVRIILSDGTSLVGNYTVDYVNQTIRFLNNSYMVTAGNITNVTYQYYPANQSCQWSAGTGSGFCEQDWSIGATCNGLNRTNCQSGGAYQNCTWSNDTWCSGAGAGTDWCNNNGGWCNHRDFAPKNCYQYDGNQTGCQLNNCSWTASQWVSCQVDWSSQFSNCLSYNSSACTTAGCYWNSNGDGWCTHPANACSSYSTQNTCIANSNCYWDQWSNWCNAKCYQSNLTQNQCNAIDICVWKDGWCNEAGAGNTCTNTTNWNNATSCDADTKCKWKNPGWCDPVGFAGSGAQGGYGFGSGGSTCFKHDGNQTNCLNATGCGWFDEPNPFCQVDFSKDCWSYYNEQSCISGGCFWANSYCVNLADQCWANATLSMNQTNCNSNAYCNWTSWNSCQSTCFQSASQATCNVTAGCKWASGWCNPASVVGNFANVSKGEPVPLGFDDFGDASPADVDIMGFGMKDMGDAYGFGVRVVNFDNASICNDEKLTSGQFGNGNDTIKFYLYLDTDGNVTGGCTLAHNTSATGYEFQFRYESVWNVSSNKAIESKAALKCSTGVWMQTPIVFTTWNKFMCSDIGGPMAAIKKADLEKETSLYNPTADMRVYVALANASRNFSSPSDTAGPGYTTPGAIDFPISGAFDYGANTALFESIMKKGFTTYEDCFNGIDDDQDNNIDCNDYNCQYADVCTGIGVNAAGYNDTSAPKVTGIRIEEYNDSALIMYDTNKPANGTLEFYYNDSLCTRLNDTIYDIGIRSASVQDFKLWHTAEIYNNSAESLNYALANNTKYYYKLKVTDSSGKSAVSKCSSFTTASTTRCPYCNFVTRLKIPSTWKVTYDMNQDGTYEHVQGEVCGPNAGLKTNYDDGRKVNIKLYKSDNSIYFEFINASLTRTALNDKVRTINGSGSIIATSTYAGLPSETRDKIVFNLHPEVCRIKIPFTGSCNQLFHCDDNGANCIDRTAAAGGAPIDATNCVWNVPNCEFSTYRESTTTDTTTTTTTTSSSGGGGGGAVTNKTTEEEQPTPVEQPTPEPTPTPTPSPAPTQPSQPSGEQRDRTGPSGGAGAFSLPFISELTGIGIVAVVLVIIIILGYFYYHGRHHIRRAKEMLSRS